MMKKQCALLAALALTAGVPVGMNITGLDGFTAIAQTSNKVTGLVLDAQGEPLIGASVVVKGQKGGSVTDIDGKFSIAARPGATLIVSCVGYTSREVKAANGMTVNLAEDTQNLNEVVVTALGIKRERKALGYAVDDIKSDELMRNKNTNAINSLSGKIAGVNVTQSSGAAGSGSQIVLRGGTSGSESRDNQPLFVVDGVIYDNSSSIAGNSAFDGMMASATTTANRVMDINPEDIENMSVLKGPAASALYGSRAANGVVIITTKKGKEGRVEVNLSAKYINSWVKDTPKTQREFRRGFMEDKYDADKNYLGTEYNDYAYNSWGDKYKQGEKTYDNLDDFFQHGGIWDTNVSVSAGTKNSSFYLSGSYYDQTGIVPTTGYKKTTFRFNGEQKYKIFTFGANVAYSDARTNKTLTGAALYGSSGTGALYGVYNWSPMDDMKHYINEDGTRYRLFGERLDPWDERDNPYWILNRNRFKDNTERFTGNFSIKADFTDWWWVSYRMGVDTYTLSNSNTIGAGGAIKKVWQNGMLSNNMTNYRYYSTNLMTNFNKTFGDFGLNLLLGTSTDYSKTRSDYEMAWNFTVPGFYSIGNATDDNKKFQHNLYRKRIVSAYGEFRADWRNTVFFTVTGRNDWSSTLPKENRSYFYPSFSGSVLFTNFFKGNLPEWLSFGKIRASWAEVGKDTGPYETSTTLWPVGTFLDGVVGVGNSWTRGNPYLKPEKTRSTEVGLEMHFFNNRLKFDAAYYTNDSFNQILSPRGPQSTGYIFCSINAGNVYNRGFELTLSGTPIEGKDFTWESSINMAHNKGTMKNLPEGMDIMYVTDVQYGGAKAATFSSKNGGTFMGIAGTEWIRDKAGNLVLDKNGMPTYDRNAIVCVGNREPKLTGGWNNTFFWKNWSFNMLWEFRIGGDVFNGTKYAMTQSGTSEFSADIRNQPLTISGVDSDGNPVSNTWEVGKTYLYNGVEMSGYNIIQNYYQGQYNYETANWVTRVNSLRLRSINLSYSVPTEWMKNHIGFVHGATFSFTANNLLLFTNYDGDPEVAAAGSGRGGSSSVGFDYCGIPSTSSVAFGVNLTF